VLIKWRGKRYLMIIEKLDKNSYTFWDEFVEASPQGSIFSKTWYLNALKINYEILVVKYNNEIKAGIVLAKNEINTYSNPLLDKYLGILFLNEQGNQQKIISRQYKYMEELIKELKHIKSFDYYFHPSFINWILFSWNGFMQETRYTYRINNNSNTLEKIYNNFHNKIIKNNIKYAQKSQVVIKQNVPFETLWRLVNETFLRQGGKAPFNKNKLEYYIDTLTKQGVLVTFGAYVNDDTCVAAGAFVYEKKSAYFLLNGIDIKNMPRGANTYMIYESIKYFHEKCDYFDFEGSMLPGVEPFYRKFGGELTPYMRIWNDNFFNYAKTKVKKIYKKIRYGR